MPVWRALNTLERKFGQWRALEPWERHQLIRLLFILPVTWLTLRVFGFKRTRAFAELKRSPEATKPEKYPAIRAQRCAQLAAIASRHGLYPANCLHQSLALCWLLRRDGLPARLRIGVLPRTQPFQAHAWVDLDGIALGPSVDQYVAFDTLTADPRTTIFL